MPIRVIATKTLGRSMGGKVPSKPSVFDGDGDGFITNPVTGEDDVPAPTAIISAPIRTLSKGVDAFDERFRKKFKQDVPQGDGDCFVAGYSLLEKMIREERDPEKRKRIRLVHGSPLGTGGDARGQRFPHSWVEVDNNPTDAEKEAMLAKLSDEDKSQLKTMWERMPEMNVTVYDYSNGREIEVPAALYYGLGNIEKSENRYYDYQEALKVSNKFGHYGPWE